ncbi:MAG: DUF3307 domain-containing protein [Candidatus Omnitrophica bacterium]|nr:DUF3307 domain-containing protein [Candidatus Omnitrophota bacterium]
MFLFLRLLLAHFIGDTILQPDEVYRIKKSGFSGTVIHVCIIFATLFLFSFPFIKHPGMWFVLVFAGLTHLIQDEMKIRKFLNQKLNFVIFVLDQCLHVACLLPVFLFKFADEAPLLEGMIAQIYANDSLIIFSTGMIVSVFLGAYLWEAFKISYFKNPVLFKSYRIKYGMFERLIFSVSVLFSAWIFLPVPFVFRVINKRLGYSGSLIFNIIYASLIGLFLRQILPIF